MWKVLCRGAGLLIGLLAAVPAFFACVARIDSAGELDYLINLDVAIGGMFAVALLLLAVPSLPGAPARWYAVAGATAVVVWLAVSGSLVWLHKEQVRIRSTPPAPHAADG